MFGTLRHAASRAGLAAAAVGIRGAARTTATAAPVPLAGGAHPSLLLRVRTRSVVMPQVVRCNATFSRPPQRDNDSKQDNEKTSGERPQGKESLRSE